MNLKLVVASMSVLGLVSCPVFAAHTAQHKKHQKSHHKMMKQKMAAHHDYKDTGSLPIQPAQETVCSVSPSSMTMVEMTQNTGRSLPNPCNPGWFNRLQMSGGLNVDLGKWGKRNANYQGENYQRLAINDVYLNLAANVNDWAKAFASISFGDPTTSPNPGTFKTQFGAAEYSSAYSNNINGSSVNNIQLEQAYATLGNFDVWPVFLEVGKQFQDFGRYEIHPITRSVTQVMSETLATSAKLGFIMSGFHGSAFVFDDPINKFNASSSPTNYGVTLGYDQPNEQLGWDVGASYLYNLIGVNDVAFAVAQNYTSSTAVGYTRRVGAYSLYGDVNSGPFTLGARFVAAMQRFNPADLAQNGIVDKGGLGGVITNANANSNGARPRAGSLSAGYDFNAWDKNQNVYVGYQTTRQAVSLNLPKHRWLAGYGVDVWKNTNLAVGWDHDKSYATNVGGMGGNSNLVSLRASVKFS